jgi:membrane protease YdiL (CAAX protease family)
MDATIPAVNRRPGTLWAVLQFPLVRFLIAFLAIFIWIGCVQVAAKLGGIAPQSPLGAMIGMVIAVGVLVIYVFYVKLLERREVMELAAKGAQRHAARGILIGAALFCTTMLVLKLLGTWSYTGTHALSSLAYPFVGAFFAGIVEETVVRGLLFRILEESLGSWIALAISAAIFGLLHSFNPGASPVSTAAIALEAGVLLAAAYMYTRSLWFVMGLHFAWNFTEGGVFAASVSGTRPEGVIGVQFAGSDLMTGGAFGPEASLPAVVICVAAGIAFIVLAQRSGRVVKPFWNRK